MIRPDARVNPKDRVPNMQSLLRLYATLVVPNAKAIV